jgi:hypothetical protein
MIFWDPQDYVNFSPKILREFSKYIFHKKRKSVIRFKLCTPPCQTTDNPCRTATLVVGSDLLPVGGLGGGGCSLHLLFAIILLKYLKIHTEGPSLKRWFWSCRASDCSRQRDQQRIPTRPSPVARRHPLHRMPTLRPRWHRAFQINFKRWKCHGRQISRERLIS